MSVAMVFELMFGLMVIMKLLLLTAIFAVPIVVCFFLLKSEVNNYVGILCFYKHFAIECASSRKLEQSSTLIHYQIV